MRESGSGPGGSVAGSEGQFRMALRSRAPVPEPGLGLADGVAQAEGRPSGLLHTLGEWEEGSDPENPAFPGKSPRQEGESSRQPAQPGRMF